MTVHCDQSVTLNALLTEYPPRVQEVLRGTFNKKQLTQAPNTDHLMMGDVILCQQLKNGEPKSSVVRQFQLEYEKFPEDAAQWSHAMVYVGGMCVAESQIYFKGLGVVPTSGVRIINLLNYCTKNYVLKVCRFKGLEKDPYNRSSIARYALFDHALSRRRYSYVRIAEMIYSKLKSKYKNLDRKEILQLKSEKAIICSEYALECLAIGGTCMTEEYQVLNGPNLPFYFPANFYTSDKFEKLDFKFVGIKNE